MSLSIPTTSALSTTQLLPATHPAVHRSLSRLTRPSLLTLVLDWLDDRNIETTNPYLAQENAEEDDDDLYPPASSPLSLREIYTDLQARKGSKRDVLDRILEGDWRDGISLYQLAMADMQYLYDHPTSQKWTALKVVPLTSHEDHAPETPEAHTVPRFHPSTFLHNLQREILPDVKAHYNLDRHPTLPLTLLRIFIVDSPYNTTLALTQKHLKNASTNWEASRTFYVAFPDAAPFIYISLNSIPPPARATSTVSDSKSLRKLVLDGIPKAFSRPRQRYKLASTNLSARNLDALVQQRGGGRTNHAGGGWGVYAEEGGMGIDTPLNIQEGHLPAPELTDGGKVAEDDAPRRKEGMGFGVKRKREDSDEVVKRRKHLAHSRFGNSALPNDGLGIERFDVRIEDPFPSSSTRLTPDDLLPDTAPSEPPPAEPKKRTGRRSTISMALDKDDEDQVGEDEDATWRPDIRVTFYGGHVFAGVRELVELGVIDGRDMPGWMTAEDGVSVGVVKEGRIRVGKR